MSVWCWALALADKARRSWEPAEAGSAERGNVADGMGLGDGNNHLINKAGGHPCSFRKIVGQRRKPLRNDADKSDRFCFG